MKQSRLASWLETCGSTATGFLLSLCLQYAICWWYDLPLRLHDNLAIIGVFTIASLIRSYGWRRLMEAFHVRRPLSPFMQAVVAERHRQQDQEGWSVEHDNDHERGVLARAGAAYLLGPRRDYYTDYEADEEARVVSGRLIWPWSIDWWKPQDFRRDLVRGCALAIAEGERHDRLKTKGRA